MKPGEPAIAPLNDAEIARRALKLLAERKMVPTPETFAEAFWESAGMDTRGAGSATVLKNVVADLMRQSRMTQQDAASMMQSAQRQQWSAVRETLDRALARRPGAVAEGWPSMLLAVLKQADLTHANWTRARKLDSIARLIDAAAADPSIALERLRRLIDSWGPALMQLPNGAGAAAAAAAANTASEPMPQQGEPAAHDVSPAADRAPALEREMAEERRIREGLQRLLALLCDNLGQLAPDEAWLTGQLEPVRNLLAGPIRPGQIAAAERRLTALVAQQTVAKRGLQEAKVALTELLTTLIESIGTIGGSTERFHEQVGGYQKQLQQAPDVATLSRIVKGLLTETQTVRAQIESSRSELSEARKKVDVYEARVSQLEHQLLEASALAQRDPLTNALNRRGMEQAFRIERARAGRYGSPLTLAMIDLDNFKQINDRFGHVAGDRALIHFVTTVHATLRPTDLTVRSGGEEFCVLFPACSVQEGIDAVERLQRELTRRPFQLDRERLILTFSAGVAQWRNGETLEELMGRSDTSLYEAKNTGKNRVLKAA
ncbi:MAG TPA: diguanylate cyclase [Burkholderiaceae bacterium]|nr:diguanylate cyclase [Burkholderiaceae bacterium]